MLMNLAGSFPIVFHMQSGIRRLQAITRSLLPSKEDFSYPVSLRFAQADAQNQFFKPDTSFGNQWRSKIYRSHFHKRNILRGKS